MTEGHDTHAGAEAQWSDPTVEEVRRIRSRLWQRAGGDVRRYIEQTRDRARTAKWDEPRPEPNSDRPA